MISLEPVWAADELVMVQLAISRADFNLPTPAKSVTTHVYQNGILGQRFLAENDVPDTR